jgi:uncharacterized protein (TIGR02301 family)
MTRLLQAESAEAGFERRLKDAFNTGFMAARQAYPECSRASRRAEAQTSEHGRSLSAALAQAVPEGDEGAGR